MNILNYNVNKINILLLTTIYCEIDIKTNKI
jgi:hypothetical protein